MDKHSDTALAQASYHTPGKADYAELLNIHMEKQMIL